MKTKFLLICVILFSTGIFAQPFGKHQRGPKERIQELERIKLLEVLDLNEEDAVRFFTRRNDFLEEQKTLMEERDAILLDMEIALRKSKSQNEFDYKISINKLSSVEKSIGEHREKFLSSLSDILTVDQVAKLIVFESKFRREIRDALMQRRGEE